MSDWHEGEILVYEKRGSTYLGKIINAAGDIQPLALVLVSREKFEEALASIAYLRRIEVKNVD